jgi:nitroimidazol reductase NimA-like FMN-containing flavoprotein (pyridoxamine 5'-phosphate oxidase superfamily)
MYDPKRRTQFSNVKSYTGQITMTFDKTDLNKVKRIPNRGHYDRETIFSVLDDGFLCHVGFNLNDQPFVIPTLYGRDGDSVFLHGSAASRMLNKLADGIAACATVTHVDGLVLARSAFHHSMNYRSAVLFGTAVEVTGEEKERGLFVISEQVLKGRWAEVRAPVEKELKATVVMRMKIESASAKIRTGPPNDEEEDYALPIWAGVIPISQTYGIAAADPKLRDGIETPASMFDLLRGGERRGG